MNEDLRTDLSVKTEINLYYDLFVPDASIEYRPLLIAVHGYGAHKRYMMREARAVAASDFVIASVQAPHQHFRKTDDGYRVGFGWLTDFRPDESIELHRRFLDSIIESLSAQKLIDKSRVFLMAFSQGCALNFRYAFSSSRNLAGVIGIGGGIPSDLESNELYTNFDSPTFYLYGDDDEFYTNERFREFDKKLEQRLTKYWSKKYEAKHEITDEMRADIKNWIAEQT